ncbi:MAG: glycosyl transferase [Sulfurovum sp. FS08-3]|nr:MAG: glycosyl transferase [Sulfurovum sp. FS08-3]
MKKVSLIIPTLNAQDSIGKLLEHLTSQEVDILIIDSSSDDGTMDIIKSYNVDYLVIPKEKFDHGGTRTLGAKQCHEADFLIYLTQDALPYDNQSIHNILKPFEDAKVGAVYGRQIANLDETIFGEHLRLFNYKPMSYVRSYEDREQYGIKTAFLSNSFSAYRVTALQEIGYFKKRLILGEDMYAGAKMLQNGYKIAYNCDAKVYHSHGYSITQEFKRYFDIGVFHRNEKWILDDFGKAEGEGIAFVKSELNYLAKKRKIYLIPIAIIRTGAKYLAYKLGYYHNHLPKYWIQKMSMHRRWWL